MIVNLTLLALAFSGSTAPDSPLNPSCANINEAQVAKLFDRWNATLQTGSAAQVAANYADHAVLLPTLSNEMRTTHAQRKDYFKYFLQSQPVGRIDDRTIFIGCQSAIDTGTYTFDFTNQPSVSARYTFTYVWQDGQWFISTHHSSAMPEPIETPNHETET